MHESRNENSSHNSHVNVISKLQNHASLQKSIAIKVKLQCSVQKKPLFIRSAANCFNSSYKILAQIRKNKNS